MSKPQKAEDASFVLDGCIKCWVPIYESDPYELYTDETETSVYMCHHDCEPPTNMKLIRLVPFNPNEEEK